MREVPCPACNGTRLKPIVARGHGRRQVDRRGRRDVDRRLRRLPARRSSCRRATSRSPSGCSRRSTSGCASWSTSASTTSRSTAPPAPSPAARRSASGSPPRSAPAWSACSTSSTSRRIGLHQRDNHRLIETLVRLRDLGNTLIVVEHDEDTIRVGRLGRRHRPGRRRARRRGRACPARSRTCSTSTDSMTGAVPLRAAGDPDPGHPPPADAGSRAHRRTAPASTTCRTSTSRSRSACFVAVTGVQRLRQVDAGQRHPLHPRWPASSTAPGPCPAGTRRVSGVDHVDKVVHVDQSPIGRTPRSNPATYTGVFDHIRKLFAETTEAKVRGYLPGPVLLQRQGRPLRGLRRRRHHQDRDELPAGRLRPVRGLPRRALQPRDARGALQGQDHRRGARHADRGGGSSSSRPSRRSRATCAR